MDNQAIQAGHWVCDRVDECIAELEKHYGSDLSAAYGEAKSSLYDWLKRYGWDGASLATVCSTIKQLSGFHPEEVIELGTAEQVRDATKAAINSIEYGNRIAPDELRNPRLWAMANIEFSYNTSGDAEDPFQYYR
jgi:hypothetical protein